MLLHYTMDSKPLGYDPMITNFGLFNQLLFQINPLLSVKWDQVMCHMWILGESEYILCELFGMCVM